MKKPTRIYCFHCECGLKYFSKTESKKLKKYNGSGIFSKLSKEKNLKERYPGIKVKKEKHVLKKLKGIKQEKVICPYCKKEGGIYAMKRWHFDNCKLKK